MQNEVSYKNVLELKKKLKNVVTFTKINMEKYKDGK